MTTIFRQYGKNPRECFEAVVSSPLALAKLWESYCRSQILVPQSAVSAPVALESFQGTEDTVESVFGLSGVARVGPWCLHPSYLSSEVTLVIHWPTFWRNAMSLFQTHPPGIFVAGLLLPAVGRVTVAGRHLLERSLLEQLDVVMLDEVQRHPQWSKEYLKCPPVNGLTKSEYPSELMKCEDVCRELSELPAFIRVCRSTFDDIFARWASVQSSTHLCRRYRQEGLIPIGDHRDYSAVRPGRVLEATHIELPEMRLKDAPLQRKLGLKFRALTPGLANEMLLAYELSRPLQGEEPEQWRERTLELGVTSFRNQEGENLVIDWGRWFDYRYATTGTFFKEAWLSALLEERTLPTQAHRRERLVERMRAAHPPTEESMFRVPGRIQIPKALLQAWDVEAGMVDVVSVRILELKSQRELAKEKGWAGMARRAKKQEKAPKRNRASEPLHFTLQLLSVGISTFLSTVKGYHQGRSIYFIIPGRYNRGMFISRKGPAHLHAQRALPSGVRFENQEWAFTAQYLARNLRIFPALKTEHLEQLLSFSQYTRQEVIGHIKRGPGRIDAGRPSKFTKEHDAAIITYYRPEMTKEASSVLWSVCQGFTPEDVARRAQILREQLIWSAGVLECDHLPHRRRGAKFLKELRQATKELQRRKGAEHEDT